MSLQAPDPDRYAVIGHPVAHSKSPLIHASFAAATDQNLVYERLLAPLDGFIATAAGFFAAGGRGLNVTVPFKHQAYDWVDRYGLQQGHAYASHAGAVNTIQPDGQGCIIGYNTDGVGLVRDIQHNLQHPIRRQRVLLLGAGGAARGALEPLLAQQPACLVISNRTPDRARDLVELMRSIGPWADSQLDWCDYGSLSGTFDLVINATSAGLDDQTLPISGQVFAPGALAYDMMYGKTTPFLHLAHQVGALACDGLGMLIEQAAEAFLIWRGIRPDTSALIQSWRQQP